MAEGCGVGVGVGVWVWGWGLEFGVRGWDQALEVIALAEGRLLHHSYGHIWHRPLRCLFRGFRV
jgi:hypothetical protein